MIVVDACVWVASLTDALSDEMANTLDDGNPVSPAHVDFEVGSALIRLGRRGSLSKTTSARQLAVENLQTPFERVRADADLADAFTFIDNARYADAIYLAMARRLRCPVMTIDGPMIKAAAIHQVDVIDARTTRGTTAHEER